MKEELRSLLQKIHDQFDAHQFESPKDYLKKKHEILNSYLPENQFLSLFDIATCEFAFVKPEVERVLGYKPEEFTFNTFISCIPHEHLVFFLQYGIISYEMMAAKDNVKILRHSYFTSFPMYKKGGQSVSIISRRSYVFQFREDIADSNIDIWEDITHTQNSEYVKCAFYSPSPEETLSLNLDFYKRWKKRLGIGYTARELQALLLFAAGNPNKDIAGIMNIAGDTVAEYFGNMKKKVKHVAHRLNTDREFTHGLPLHFDLPHYMTRNELLQYSLHFGLLPDNILKRHFLSQPL